MNKTWIGAALALAIILSFVISESFWGTLSRKRAIQKASKEIERLDMEIQITHEKILNLETNPQSYELLVRQELGYMRPGEKEIRFLNRKNP